MKASFSIEIEEENIELDPSGAMSDTLIEMWP